MADQNDLEIYKQRYETYRHLDRLRWLMFLAAVGVALLYLLLGGFRFGSAGWLVLGVLLLSLGAAKLRIGQKAAEFAEALAAFAQSSENAENIPETPQQGASFWFGRILAAFGAACFLAALIFYIDDLAGSDGHFIWSWNVWAVAGVFLICSGLAKLRIGNPNAEVPKLARKGWNYWVIVGLAAAGCLVIGYILVILPGGIAHAPDEILKSLPYIAFFAVMGASLTAPWFARRRFGYRRLVRSKLLRRFWEEVGGMDAPTGAPFWIAYDMIVAGVVFWAGAAVSFLFNWQ